VLENLSQIFTFNQKMLNICTLFCDRAEIKLTGNLHIQSTNRRILDFFQSWTAGEVRPEAVDMLSSEAVEATGEGSHVVGGGGHGAAGKPSPLARPLSRNDGRPAPSRKCIMFLSNHLQNRLFY
jgi:hypothetical protein